MDDDTALIVIASVFGTAVTILIIIALLLFLQINSLKKKVAEMQVGRMRVQKLKMNNDKNHAFHNQALAPDEELSRRGYSMYQSDDLESGRHERQTGGQHLVDRRTPSLYDERQAHPPHFVDELTRELDSRQQKPNNPPPFLLQSIQDHKKKTRNLTNPMAASGRQSGNNPNFIY